MNGTTRKVSNDVYSEIQSRGILKGIRWEVYDYIFRHGPVTISQALRDIPHKRDSSINARFSELRAMGAVAVVNTVQDPLGDHEVALWDVTQNLPKKLDKKVTTFWIVFSEKSGTMGYASPNKSDIEDAYEDFKKKPNRDDAQIFKAQVVKPE